MIFFDSLLIVLYFFLFALSHTFLASNNIKNALAAKIGSKIAFYRLFYNLSSLLILTAVFSLAPNADLIIYELRVPFDMITFGLQIIALIGLIWSVRTIDLKEFLGISQIARYFKGEYSTNDLDERLTLNIIGPYRYVRHPIYLFSILFMGLRPVMDLFYLLFYISMIAYFYIGSVYEERKLVNTFGSLYTEYQKQVPRIFPYKPGLKKRNAE